jgi:hypothetical protein
MRKGREQELRAGQKKFPLRWKSRRGKRVLEQSQAKTNRSISVDWTVAGANTLVAVRS